MEFVDCLPGIDVDVDNSLRSALSRNCSPPAGESWSVELGLESSVIRRVAAMVRGPLGWGRLESETKGVQEASERIDVLDDHVDRSEPRSYREPSLVRRRPNCETVLSSTGRPIGASIVPWPDRGFRHRRSGHCAGGAGRGRELSRARTPSRLGTGAPESAFWTPSARRDACNRTVYASSNPWRSCCRMTGGSATGDQGIAAAAVRAGRPDRTADERHLGTALAGGGARILFARSVRPGWATVVVEPSIRHSRRRRAAIEIGQSGAMTDSEEQEALAAVTILDFFSKGSAPLLRAPRGHFSGSSATSGTSRRASTRN